LEVDEATHGQFLKVRDIHGYPGSSIASQIVDQQSGSLDPAISNSQAVWSHQQWWLQFAGLESSGRSLGRVEMWG